MYIINDNLNIYINKSFTWLLMYFIGKQTPCFGILIQGDKDIYAMLLKIFVLRTPLLTQNLAKTMRKKFLVVSGSCGRLNMIFL